MTFFYVLTKCLTAPGAALHAFWEHMVCKICKIPVEDNRYLQANEMCGHVDHAFALTPRAAFALCYVPMFFNLLGAFLMGLLPAFKLLYIGDFSLPGSLFDIAAIWFALSLFTNVSPLVEDAMKMWSLLYSKSSNPAQKLFYTPGAVVCYLAAYLDRLSIPFIIGVAITAVAALV